MTASEIINNVARSPEYLSIARKLSKGTVGDFSEDLFQELVLILCEYDINSPGKLEEINAKGQLKFFIVGILKKMFHSSTSQFYRKYREIPTIHLDFSRLEIESEEYNEDEEALIKRVVSEFDTDKPMNRDEYYEKTLFREFVKVGSKSKLSDKTGIDRRSIAYTINKVKDEIKQKIRL